KPNPWGLHDIYGNVSEWVIDAYDEKGYERFGGKLQAWDAAVAWPTKIFPGVARGGNWEAEPEDCRSAARLKSSRDLQRRDPQIPKSIWWYTDAFHIGFRVVRPSVEPSEAEKRRYWGDGTIEKIERILTTGGKQLRAKVDAAPKK
ncbi:MAG: SUMF1/EgtB/PvdO family nonheme iron enzyme, partial [Planctomycetota bacterium]